MNLKSNNKTLEVYKHGGDNFIFPVGGGYVYQPSMYCPSCAQTGKEVSVDKTEGFMVNNEPLVEESKQYDLNEIFKRLIYAESNFNPKAESSVGAKGIAQFMPNTLVELRRLGFTDKSFDVFDPNQAIPAAKKYFDWIQERPYLAKGTPEVQIAKALVGYNYGIGKTKKLLETIKDDNDIYNNLDWLEDARVPEESRNYVYKILNLDVNKNFNKESDSVYDIEKFNTDYEKALDNFTFPEFEDGGSLIKYQDAGESINLNTNVGNEPPNEGETINAYYARIGFTQMQKEGEQGNFVWNGTSFVPPAQSNDTSDDASDDASEDATTDNTVDNTTNNTSNQNVSEDVTQNVDPSKKQQREQAIQVFMSSGMSREQAIAKLKESGAYDINVNDEGPAFTNIYEGLDSPLLDVANFAQNVVKEFNPSSYVQDNSPEKYQKTTYTNPTDETMYINPFDNKQLLNRQQTENVLKTEFYKQRSQMAPNLFSPVTVDEQGNTYYDSETGALLPGDIAELAQPGAQYIGIKNEDPSKVSATIYNVGTADKPDLAVNPYDRNNPMDTQQRTRIATEEELENIRYGGFLTGKDFFTKELKKKVGGGIMYSDMMTDYMPMNFADMVEMQGGGEDVVTEETAFLTPRELKLMDESGSLPLRYKRRGFDKIGTKVTSDKKEYDFMMLLKKGDKFKIVYGNTPSNTQLAKAQGGTEFEFFDPTFGKNDRDGDGIPDTIDVDAGTGTGVSVVESAQMGPPEMDMSMFESEEDIEEPSVEEPQATVETSYGDTLGDQIYNRFNQFRDSKGFQNFEKASKVAVEGAKVLNKLAEQRQRDRADAEAKLQLADAENIFGTTFADDRGDYDVNTGLFRTDDKTISKMAQDGTESNPIMDMFAQQATKLDVGDTNFSMGDYTSKYPKQSYNKSYYNTFNQGSLIDLATQELMKSQMPTITTEQRIADEGFESMSAEEQEAYCAANPRDCRNRQRKQIGFNVRNKDGDNEFTLQQRNKVASTDMGSIMSRLGVTKDSDSLIPFVGADANLNLLDTFTRTGRTSADLFAKGKLGVNLNPNLKEDPELHAKGSVGVRGNLGFDIGRSGSQFSFMPSASYKFGDSSSSGLNLGLGAQTRIPIDNTDLRLFTDAQYNPSSRSMIPTVGASVTFKDGGDVVDIDEAMLEELMKAGADIEIL